MEKKQMLKKLATSIVAFSFLSVFTASVMSTAEAAPPYRSDGPRWEEHKNKRKPVPPLRIHKDDYKRHDYYRKTPPPPPPRRPEYHNHHRREEIKVWHDKYGRRHKDRIWWDRYGHRHVERIY